MTVGPASRPVRRSTGCTYRQRRLAREWVGPRADSSSKLEPPRGGGAGERCKGPFGPGRPTAASGREPTQGLSHIDREWV